MTYPCLVLDHDDTVVNSTATVHYPCFAEYTAKFSPGRSATRWRNTSLKTLTPASMTFSTVRSA